MPVPPELDYERWPGPAPRAPYTEKRVHPPKSYERPGWMRHLYYCDGMVAQGNATATGATTTFFDRPQFYGERRQTNFGARVSF